jgi:hypothetical protein
MTRLATISALALFAGCPDPADPPPWVELSAITTPPPSSTATVRNTEYVDGKPVDVYEITLSTGVAIATRCADSCAYSNSLQIGCAGAKLTAGDPSKLGVWPVYHDGDPGEFALVASAPGATTLRVQTTCATQDYTVNIIARP